MLSLADTSSHNVPLSLFSDPAFRRDLATDPVKTLAAHGIRVAEGDLPADIRLPSLGESDAISVDPGHDPGPGNGHRPPSPPSPTNPIDIPIWSVFLS